MKNKQTEKYLYLLDYIPTGKANGIKRKEIAKHFNISVREVSASIEQLRRAGLFIASSNAGYYLPANTEELEEFYNTNRKRAISLLGTLSATRKELAKRKETEQK